MACLIANFQAMLRRGTSSRSSAHLIMILLSVTNVGQCISQASVGLFTMVPWRQPVVNRVRVPEQRRPWRHSIISAFIRQPGRKLRSLLHSNRRVGLQSPAAHDVSEGDRTGPVRASRHEGGSLRRNEEMNATSNPFKEKRGSSGGGNISWRKLSD